MAPSADQGGRVGQAGPLVGRRVQAHGDPPAVSGGQPAGGLHRGGQHRVVDRRERRGVAEVERGQVVHAEPGVQRGGQHVDALGGALAARELPAEQPPLPGVHQPDVQRRGARVVLGAGPGDLVGGHRVQPGRLRLGQPQPGPGHLQVEHLDHRGADHAAERGGPAGGHGPGHPAGLVGGGTERDPGGAAQHQVRQRDRVAGREHARQRGAHSRVHHHRSRPAGAVAPAWISRSVAGRTPTAMTTRSVGISSPSTTAVRQPAGVLPRSTASSRAAEPQRGVPFELGLGQRGDRLVHGAQHAGQRLDHVHVHARADQRFRGLQARCTRRPPRPRGGPCRWPAAAAARSPRPGTGS